MMDGVSDINVAVERPSQIPFGTFGSGTPPAADPPGSSSTPGPSYITLSAVRHPLGR
jgi:hypothetical protein